MVFEPRGVAVVITPWNDPVAVSCGLLGAALVTGNPVVYKPSERTPATGWLLGRLCAESLSPAGAPPGVLATLSGGAQVGARLVEDADWTSSRTSAHRHRPPHRAGRARSPVPPCCARTAARTR